MSWGNSQNGELPLRIRRKIFVEIRGVRAWRIRDKGHVHADGRLLLTIEDCPANSPAQGTNPNIERASVLLKINLASGDVLHSNLDFFEVVLRRQPHNADRVLRWKYTV